MKKNNVLTVFVLMLAAAFASCQKEGDMIYLSGHTANELTATETNVVLTQEDAGKVVLSFTWSKSTLVASDPSVTVPDLESIYLQASTLQDFSGSVTESIETNMSRAYTGAELNTLAKNLALPADVPTDVYFRLRSLTGNNMEPLYSNVETVTITAYDIDMSVGFVLDSKKELTSFTLTSPASDGIYRGFMGVTAWYNFYLREGDGTLWGNDGVDGSAFLLSSDEATQWNFWYPYLAGCYYTQVNTVAREWSATLLPTLTVSGDVQGQMTFDRPNNTWLLPFEAQAAGTLTITLQCADAQLFDLSTGADEAATPKAASIAFAQADGVLTLSDAPAQITVSVPSAGECTLAVNLSTPGAWTATVTAGSEEPKPINPYIYLPGVDDGISGSWTFDNKLALYNEDELAYAGVANANSAWGYSINIEADNWADKYTFGGEGDAYAGTLAWQGENNIPAPEPGLYLFDVSLKALTYNLVSVGSEIYVSGLNDAWDFETKLTATDAPGVFAGTVVVEKASEWGFQIHLNDSWNNKYGGADGILYYQGTNLTDDARLGAGTYTLTVDLIAGTYTME